MTRFECSDFVVTGFHCSFEVNREQPQLTSRRKVAGLGQSGGPNFCIANSALTRTDVSRPFSGGVRCLQFPGLTNWCFLGLCRSALYGPAIYRLRPPLALASAIALERGNTSRYTTYTYAITTRARGQRYCIVAAPPFYLLLTESVHLRSRR